MRIIILFLLLCGTVSFPIVAKADKNLMMTYTDLATIVPKQVERKVKLKELLKPITYQQGRVSILPIAPRVKDSGKLFKLGLTVSVALGSL